MDLNGGGAGGADDQASERERMKLLVANFDEQQMARYEAFRRANISRNSVRKFSHQVLNQTVTSNVSVMLSGMSKVLIGDIIERARDVQQREFELKGIPLPKEGEEPKPLLPEHLRKAWKLYKLETGTVPGKRRRIGDANRLF